MTPETKLTGSAQLLLAQPASDTSKIFASLRSQSKNLRSSRLPTTIRVAGEGRSKVTRPTLQVLFYKNVIFFIFL